MSETGSSTYTRAVREQIEHLAVGAGRDEAECLSLLRRKLSTSRIHRHSAEREASFDDMVFLPANLTRLVIDPYREPCNTRTVIGARAVSPLKLSGPILIGGIPFSRIIPSALRALCHGARAADIAMRVPIGFKLATGEPPVIRVAPLRERAHFIDTASAIELASEETDTALDPGALRGAAEAWRAVAPQIPIGIGIGPCRVEANVQAAVESGLDFVTLNAMRLSDGQHPAGWIELCGMPRIAVLVEAVASLRAIQREEDIDLIYFGCIRDGADVAKALALGATAVMIGQAALIAVGAGPLSEEATHASQSEIDAEHGGESLMRFLRATSMEVSVLTRGCGKSDVHNLEPEDLRSLSVETSRATGIPLVGKDKLFSGKRLG